MFGSPLLKMILHATAKRGGWVPWIEGGRLVAFVTLLAACSSKHDAPKPVDSPPANVAPIIPCPEGMMYLEPWAHELFDGCPPPQLWTLGIHCIGGACPKPCRLHGERNGEPFDETITYDEHGRWIETTTVPPGFHRCRYDDAGRMTACEGHDREPAQIDRRADGRIIGIVSEDGGQTYGYDDHDRVVTIDHPLLGHTDLTYDAAGWLRSENRSSPVDEIVYHYDARGRVTRFDAQHATVDRYTYDDAGHLLEDLTARQRARYTYDAKGRPVTYVREDDGKLYETQRYDYCDP